MHRSSRCIVFSLTILAVGVCLSQDRTTEVKQAETAEVRRAAEEYIAALHAGDGKALAAMWTANGDFVDSSGRVTKGRSLAAQVGKAKQPESDTSRSEQSITVDSIRLVTPDVAIEDGTTDVPEEDGDFLVARYSAIWMKHDGKWLLDSVRESAPQTPSNRDRLRPLNWMIGQWVQEEGDGNLEVNCRRSPDGNYLLREIKVESPEGKTHSMSQRLGWDPAKLQITAWTFDSDGGFATGIWKLQGTKWVVDTEGVIPSGENVSCKSSYTRDGDERFTLESTQRAGDGSPTVHRKLGFVRRKSNDKSSERE